MQVAFDHPKPLPETPNSGHRHSDNQCARDLGRGDNKQIHRLAAKIFLKHRLGRSLTPNATLGCMRVARLSKAMTDRGRGETRSMG